MAARPAVLAYEYRPYLEQSCFHRAEIALDSLQRHVTVVNGLGGELVFRNVGDDDITASQIQGALFGLWIDNLDDLPPLQAQLDDAIEFVSGNPLGQRPQTGFRLRAWRFLHMLITLGDFLSQLGPLIVQTMLQSPGFLRILTQNESQLVGFDLADLLREEFHLNDFFRKQFADLWIGQSADVA